MPNFHLSAGTCMGRSGQGVACGSGCSGDSRSRLEVWFVACIDFKVRQVISPLHQVSKSVPGNSAREPMLTLPPISSTPASPLPLLHTPPTPPHPHPAPPPGRCLCPQQWQRWGAPGRRAPSPRPHAPFYHSPWGCSCQRGAGAAGSSRCPRAATAGQETQDRGRGRGRWGERGFRGLGFASAFVGFHTGA